MSSVNRCLQGRRGIVFIFQSKKPIRHFGWNHIQVSWTGYRSAKVQSRALAPTHVLNIGDVTYLVCLQEREISAKTHVVPAQMGESEGDGGRANLNSSTTIRV